MKVPTLGIVGIAILASGLGCGSTASDKNDELMRTAIELASNGSKKDFSVPKTKDGDPITLPSDDWSVSSLSLRKGGSSWHLLSKSGFSVRIDKMPLDTTDKIWQDSTKASGGLYETIRAKHPEDTRAWSVGEFSAKRCYSSYGNEVFVTATSKKWVVSFDYASSGKDKEDIISLADKFSDYILAKNSW